MQPYQNWYDCMQYIPELVYLQYANYNSMRDLIYMDFFLFSWLNLAFLLIFEKLYLKHAIKILKK